MRGIQPLVTFDTAVVDDSLIGGGEIHFDIGPDLSPGGRGAGIEQQAARSRRNVERPAARMRNRVVERDAGQVPGAARTAPTGTVGCPPWPPSSPPCWAAPFMYHTTSVQAMPPMRNEVSVPGIRNDRGKLPVVTGAVVGRVAV